MKYKKDKWLGSVAEQFNLGNASKTMKLNQQQIDFFHTEGYLVVDPVYSEADIQPVVDDLNGEVTRRAQKLVDQGKLSRTFEEEGFERQLARISEETDQLALSIWNNLLHGPGIFHMIPHPALIDVVEQFCGPEIIASSVYRLRPKIPNYDYGAVPWHQDSSYFEPYCDNALVLTVWVPLVEATRENGCLWVYPGSHQMPVIEHRADASRKYLEIGDENLPETERMMCPVRKGGLLLLTNRTIHGSLANTTDAVRWSMDLRYQSAALPTNAQITRLEGEATAMIDADVPAACFPPEPDFLVRSQKRPDEVMTRFEDFRHIRENHPRSDFTNRWNVKWAEPKAESL